jgi:hypothetical protein
MIFKYLDGLDLVKVKEHSYYNMTRLFYKGDEQYPENAIFEAYNETDEEEGEYRLLLVDNKLCKTIGSLFSITEFKYIEPILLRWFNEYADDNCVKAEMIHY